MRLGGVIFLLCIFPFLRLSGQNIAQIPEDEGFVPFKDRIAIRTNVVDWALTTPNIAFDYDIVSTPYDKQSVGLGVKYNWNTSHTYIPKLVYNLLDLRADYRFYWRLQPYDDRETNGDWEREWIDNAKGLEKLRARINCFRGTGRYTDIDRENGETPGRMSFFVGPYLSVSNFSIKLGAADDALGRQGIAFGAGLTGGIALPLYGYENGSALDLEFGGSVGWHYASFDLYVADIEANGYPHVGHRNKFVFYPLVTDARVSLVYRFRTIAKQHTKIDYDLVDRRYIARLMEGDKKGVKAYNDSIKTLKGMLDRRNEEIALYKQTVEREPGFNPAYALEYLTPYANWMEAPRKYTRLNKDTLPKVQIDSMGQITDYVLLSMRNDIDSIPHMTSEQIDDEFVKQYNLLSAHPDKRSLNRTELIRNICNQLNSYIEDNNVKLIAGTFGAKLHTEQVSKFNVKNQNRVNVDIVYKDSVRTVAMTDNEKIEWRNSIKKRAWADTRNRAKGIYVGRVEAPVIGMPVVADSIAVDSLKADSIAVDSVKIDSLAPAPAPVEAVPADTAVTAAVGCAVPGWYALRCKECIIKEEDDEA